MKSFIALSKLRGNFQLFLVKKKTKVFTLLSSNKSYKADYNNSRLKAEEIQYFGLTFVNILFARMW